MSQSKVNPGGAPRTASGSLLPRFPPALVRRVRRMRLGKGRAGRSAVAPHSAGAERYSESWRSIGRPATSKFNPIRGREGSKAVVDPASNYPTPETYRLAYVTNQYPAVSHTFIFNEIRELRSLGFEVATSSINACDRSWSQLPDMERVEQAQTFYIKPAGWRGAARAFYRSMMAHPAGFFRGFLFTFRLGGTAKRFFYFVEALMIGMWMHDHRLAHLHAHFGTAASSAAMIAARTFPITLSLTIHGPDEFHEVSRNYLPQKIAAARFICCIGMFARSQLMRICPVEEWRKLELVPLGVDPELFTPCPPRLRPKVFEVLCVGRLVPAKGQHILLSAVARLVGEHRSIRLRLIGDGPDRATIERRILGEGLENHVFLEGAVNPDRISDFLKQADAVALASFAEGIPVALMEAMAVEVPCISTMVAGIPELIRSEVDGLLVPASDEEQLASALRRLMDDHDLRRRLGAAGRARVSDKFNLKKNVAKLADIYKCHLSPPC
jgi:colanic acid/amylovoran biosynthesis glycosyltransferase